MRPSPSERFERFVHRTNTCWLWMGRGWGRNCEYGAFWLNGRDHVAHRVAYEMAKGPIPEGLHLDHLCRTPKCVNPDHLEPVTNRENILRGEGITAVAFRKTHCDNGHPFDLTNTRFTSNGNRVCRACDRLRGQAYRDRIRASTRAPERAAELAAKSREYYRQHASERMAYQRIRRERIRILAGLR